MTATVYTVITCNGLQGAGCPLQSRITLEVFGKRSARSLAADQGWDYKAVYNRKRNVEYVDTCSACSGGGDVQR